MDLSPEMRIDRSRTDGDVDVTELQVSISLVVLLNLLTVSFKE